MPDKELRERLANLHAELERAGSVDDESRRLLVTLADDIRGVLDRADDESREQDHASLGERLADAAREFEESHPQIAAAVGRVADTLSSLGI